MLLVDILCVGNDCSRLQPPPRINWANARAVHSFVTGLKCHWFCVHGQGGEDGQQLSIGQKVAEFRSAFWKFLRPHTIRGTILGASAVTARALLENQHVSLPVCLRDGCS